MEQIILQLFPLLTFIAGGILVALFAVNRIGHWRVKCIELEHDLARAENRQPRKIYEL